MKCALIFIPWLRTWKHLPMRPSAVAQFSSRMKAMGNNSFPVCTILVEGEEGAFFSEEICAEQVAEFAQSQTSYSQSLGKSVALLAAKHPHGVMNHLSIFHTSPIFFSFFCGICDSISIPVMHPWYILAVVLYISSLQWI